MFLHSDLRESQKHLKIHCRPRLQKTRNMFARYSSIVMDTYRSKFNQKHTSRFIYHGLYEARGDSRSGCNQGGAGIHPYSASSTAASTRSSTNPTATPTSTRPFMMAAILKISAAAFI